MSTKNVMQLAIASLALGLAALLFIRFHRESEGLSEKAFFYDLSENKLFTAARTSVPPINGINDVEEDAMRAVVISTTGNPRDKNSWKIAYLEKYSPQFKRQIEDAQRTGNPPQISRDQGLAHRFVRRTHDSKWHPMTSPEAEKILNEWAAPGENGITPIVCSP